MRRAICFLRDAPWHRREHYARGLERIGFHVSQFRGFAAKANLGPGDVLVIWNRMPHEAPTVAQFERAGVTILVTENGWTGQSPDGGKLYALARDQHNGAGYWPVGEDDRFSRMGINLRPWRRNGGHLLALGQRGFGPHGVAAPKDWLPRIPARLRGCTARAIQLRAHPGRVNPRPNLEPALADCWAVLTWSSGAAIKAIAAGVPAFHDMPSWIGAPAAKHGFSDLEHPFLGDRMPMFHRLSHAQWSVDELASGEPFARLLDM